VSKQKAQLVLTPLTTIDLGYLIAPNGRLLGDTFDLLILTVAGSIAIFQSRTQKAEACHPFRTDPDTKSTPPLFAGE
jgi:hypothetical protein